MTSSKISRIARIYDERSSNYDDSFHPRLAEDFIKWADLQPGQNVLDLCCGTGLVSLSAQRVVGSSGRVIGVDISNKMLDEGRRKADESGLEVTFINDDVTDMSREKMLLDNDQGFDLITCAAALVLLDNPLSALKHWATFLAPAGKLIVDVPSEKSLIVAHLVEKVVHEAGLSPDRLFTRGRYPSMASWEEDIHAAGLSIIRIFETESYGRKQIMATDAQKEFDRHLGYVYGGETLDADLKKNLVRRLGLEHEKVADSSGVIEEDARFYVVIAGKTS